MPGQAHTNRLLDVKIVVVEISESLSGILGTAKVLTSRAKVLLLASSTSAQRDHRWWSVHRWFRSSAGICRGRWWSVHRWFRSSATRTSRNRWWSVYRWLRSSAWISRDRSRGYVLTRVVIEVVGSAIVGLKTSAALATI